MGREFVHTILLLASAAVYFNSALAQSKLLKPAGPGKNLAICL